MNLDVLAAEITQHTALGERAQHITVVLVGKEEPEHEDVTQGRGGNVPLSWDQRHLTGKEGPRDHRIIFS